jgi:hypothetical protein
MSGQFVRELREVALAILTPLPFVLPLMYAVETVTNPLLLFLFLYHLLAFTFVLIERMITHVREAFEKARMAADPSTVSVKDGPLFDQIRDLANRWKSGDSELEREALEEKEIGSLLPGLVYGVLNSLVSMVLYVLSGSLLVVLAEIGRLQGTLTTLESLLEGPEGTFISTLLDVTALNVLLETLFSGLNGTDAILLIILLLLPAYFALNAARQLTYASEQAHLLFLEKLHGGKPSVLKSEASGILFLFVFYVGLLVS